MSSWDKICSCDYVDLISKHSLVFDIGEDRDETPYDESLFDRFYTDDYFSSLEEKEKFRDYQTQVTLSQGFDLEMEDPISVIGGICPHPDIKKDPSLLEDAGTLARIALGINNCRLASKKLEFVEVQKLNTAVCAGSSYFITFLAKECSSGQVRVYQTKVHDMAVAKIIMVVIFREKPPKSLLLMTPEELSSLDLDEAKDYDGLLYKTTLVFEVEEDDEETSSDESESDESESDTSHKDDVFDTPEHKKLKLTQGLDLQLDNLNRKLSLDLYATAEKLTRVAIGMNNCRPVSEKVEFVEIEKGDHTFYHGFSYFITFLAKDCSTGRLMVYETKIQDLSGRIKVVIFREKDESQEWKHRVCNHKGVQIFEFCPRGSFVPQWGLKFC